MELRETSVGVAFYWGEATPIRWDTLLRQVLPANDSLIVYRPLEALCLIPSPPPDLQVEWRFFCSATGSLPLFLLLFAQHPITVGACCALSLQSQAAQDAPKSRRVLPTQRGRVVVLQFEKNLCGREQFALSLPCWGKDLAKNLGSRRCAAKAQVGHLYFSLLAPRQVCGMSRHDLMAQLGKELCVVYG